MNFYKLKQKGTYSSADDNYVIREGERYRWYSYFTPGGPAEKLTKYPNKSFNTAIYVCDYHKIVNNSEYEG